MLRKLFTNHKSLPELNTFLKRNAFSWFTFPIQLVPILLLVTLLQNTYILRFTLFLISSIKVVNHFLICQLGIHKSIYPIQIHNWFDLLFYSTHQRMDINILLLKHYNGISRHNSCNYNHWNNNGNCFHLFLSLRCFQNTTKK